MSDTSSELPVAEDRAFESRHKQFQRVGWFFLLLLLLGALAGFLGSGAFSTQTIGTADFSLKYDRILQRQTPAELRIRIHAESQSGAFTITLPAAYLEKVTIEKIIPEPTEARLTDGGITWTFAASTGRISSDIYFEIEGKHSGNASGGVQVGKSRVPFTQYILP